METKKQRVRWVQSFISLLIIGIMIFSVFSGLKGVRAEEKTEAINVRTVQVLEENSLKTLNQKLEEVKEAGFQDDVIYKDVAEQAQRTDLSQAELKDLTEKLENLLETKKKNTEVENSLPLNAAAEKSPVQNTEAQTEAVPQDIPNALELDTQATALKDPIKDLPYTVDAVISACASTFLKNFSETEPRIGTNGGEWTIMCLARSGYGNQELYNTYYRNVKEQIISSDGVLDKMKYTEYSRVILGLTAIGRDVTNVGGYNLLNYMTDFSKITRQGINGPIWALIALDSHNYPIYTDPQAKDQNSREKMVNYILSKETKDKDNILGGWAMSGSADPDITAMAIIALNNYMDMPGVKDAVDRGKEYLSRAQIAKGGDNDGGYATYGVANLESVAQVVMALCDSGIDIKTDSRYIKGSDWTLSALLKYYMPTSSRGAGFMHVKPGESGGGEGEGEPGVWNDMSTDQGTEALISYQRLRDGQNSFFDMNDVPISEIPLENISLKGIKGFFDKNRESQVALKLSFNPVDANDIEKITWSTDNASVATVNDQGIVTVLSGETAKAIITVSVKTVNNTFSANYYVQRGATVEETEKAISELPEFMDKESMAVLLYASRAYDSLNEDEKKRVSSEKLFKAQEQAKSINHVSEFNYTEDAGKTIYNRNFSLTNDLPWYIQIETSRVGMGERVKIEKEMAAFSKKKMMQLADVKLYNLMNDDPSVPWQPEKPIKVTVEVPYAEAEVVKNAEIWHYESKDDGTVEAKALKTTASENYQDVSFETQSFSPFAFVTQANGGVTPTPTPTPNQEGTSNNQNNSYSERQSGTEYDYFGGGSTSKINVTRNTIPGSGSKKNLPTIGNSGISMVDITGTGKLQTKVVEEGASLFSQILDQLKGDIMPFVMGGAFMTLILCVIYLIKLSKSKKTA